MVIFASVYASAIYNFMIDIGRNYIDKNLQEGFWKGVDGVTEHTEMLRTYSTQRSESSAALPWRYLISETLSGK